MSTGSPPLNKEVESDTDVLTNYTPSSPSSLSDDASCDSCDESTCKSEAEPDVTNTEDSQVDSAKGQTEEEKKEQSIQSKVNDKDEDDSRTKSSEDKKCRSSSRDSVSEGHDDEEDKTEKLERSNKSKDEKRRDSSSEESSTRHDETEDEKEKSEGKKKNKKSRSLSKESKGKSSDPKKSKKRKYRSSSRDSMDTDENKKSRKDKKKSKKIKSKATDKIKSSKKVKDNKKRSSSRDNDHRGHDSDDHSVRGDKRKTSDNRKSRTVAKTDRKRKESRSRDSRKVKTKKVRRSSSRDSDSRGRQKKVKSKPFKKRDKRSHSSSESYHKGHQTDESRSKSKGVKKRKLSSSPETPLRKQTIKNVRPAPTKIKKPAPRKIPETEPMKINWTERWKNINLGASSYLTNYLDDDPDPPQESRDSIIQNWQTMMRAKIQNDKQNNEIGFKKLEMDRRRFQEEISLYEKEKIEMAAQVQKKLQNVAQVELQQEKRLGQCAKWEHQLKQREAKLLEDCIKYEQRLSRLNEKLKLSREQDEKLNAKHFMLVQDELRLQKEKQILLEFVTKCSAICEINRKEQEILSTAVTNLSQVDCGLQFRKKIVPHLLHRAPKFEKKSTPPVAPTEISNKIETPPGESPAENPTDKIPIDSVTIPETETTQLAPSSDSQDIKISSDEKLDQVEMPLESQTDTLTGEKTAQTEAQTETETRELNETTPSQAQVQETETNATVEASVEDFDWYYSGHPEGEAIPYETFIETPEGYELTEEERKVQEEAARKKWIAAQKLYHEEKIFRDQMWQMAEALEAKKKRSKEKDRVRRHQEYAQGREWRSRSDRQDQERSYEWSGYYEHDPNSEPVRVPKMRRLPLRGRRPNWGFYRGPKMYGTKWMVPMRARRRVKRSREPVEEEEEEEEWY